jgi:ParB family chromosome partitioning protein
VDGSAAIGKLVDSLGTGGDARAQIITLALVLGSLEARLCGVPRCVHCSQVLTNLGGINVRDGMSHGGSASERFRSGLRLFRLRCMSWRSKGFGVCSGR